MKIYKNQGFQRELVPFGRGLGGQRPPTKLKIDFLVLLI